MDILLPDRCIGKGEAGNVQAMAVAHDDVQRRRDQIVGACRAVHHRVSRAGWQNAERHAESIAALEQAVGDLVEKPVPAHHDDAVVLGNVRCGTRPCARLAPMCGDSFE